MGLSMYNETTFKLPLWTNPISNEVYISLLTRFALNENLNVVLFYICNKQNRCNPKS
jgi:hypothetical protein